METTYLSWNFTNWITIVLMAALGFMLLSFGSQLFQNKGN